MGGGWRDRVLKRIKLLMHVAHERSRERRTRKGCAEFRERAMASQPLDGGRSSGPRSMKRADVLACPHFKSRLRHTGVVTDPHSSSHSSDRFAAALMRLLYIADGKAEKA